MFKFEHLFNHNQWILMDLAATYHQFIDTLMENLF